MSYQQSATVAGLDYEKQIDSRFVTMVIAHQRRTNKTIGINQPSNLERGLFALRAKLINDTIDHYIWQSAINSSADELKRIMARFEAGEIDGKTAMSQAAEIENAVTVAREKLGLK